MTRPDWDQVLRQTLDDLRLSRAEKKALSAVLEEQQPDPSLRAKLRSQAFDLARQEITDPTSHQVLDWLEGVVKALASAGRDGAERRSAEACFTPSTAAPRRIAELIRGASRSVDVCVFTITDDRISDAILDAHQRGRALRIITDDDKAHDRGSDVTRLLDAGVPLRMDRSEHHMHHKFAIFDGRLLLTGSYNWTRAAAAHNEENFVILDDPRLVGSFSSTFDTLWDRFGP